MLDYKQYLQSQSWREKRRQALEYYGFACCCCKSTERLEVHHRHYKRIFRERMEDLAVVCHSCHRDIHGKWATVGISRRDKKQRRNKKRNDAAPRYALDPDCLTAKFLAERLPQRMRGEAYYMKQRLAELIAKDD